MDKGSIQSYLLQASSWQLGACNTGGTTKSDVILQSSGTLGDVYSIGISKNLSDNDSVIVGCFGNNKFILSQSPYITGKT